MKMPVSRRRFMQGAVMMAGTAAAPKGWAAGAPVRIDAGWAALCRLQARGLLGPVHSLHLSAPCGGAHGTLPQVLEAELARCLEFVRPLEPHTLSALGNEAGFSALGDVAGFSALGDVAGLASANAQLAVSLGFPGVLRAEILCRPDATERRIVRCAHGHFSLVDGRLSVTGWEAPVPPGWERRCSAAIGRQARRLCGQAFAAAREARTVALSGARPGLQASESVY